MNIQDLLNSEMGQQIVGNISQQFGLDQNQAVSAIQAAVPMIIGGLGHNAQTQEGAQAINAALDNKHDGSLLDNLGSFFGNSDAAQQDGAGILGHIFGNKVEDVNNGVAEHSGISLSKIGPIIAMLAPIVMAYIGRQKQQNGVQDASGLGGLLGGLANSITGSQQNQGGGLIDMVSGMLGGNQSAGGILGGLLGMLGK